MDNFNRKFKKDGSILGLRNASIFFSGVKALRNVSFDVFDREVVTIVGPNGAGKSTLLKSLFGIYPLRTGAVLWKGKRIHPISHEMVKRGVSFVPQGRQIFKSLSVRENLEIGGMFVHDPHILNERMVSILRFFPELSSKLERPSGTLSGGQQQMLAIARGLMSNPQVLLLDEPSLGLSPKFVHKVFEKIDEIRRQNHISIVIVEHNIQLAFRITDRAYLLERGEIIYSGNPQSLLQSTLLKDTFMGTDCK